MGCASIARRLVIPAILSLPDRYELAAVASRDRGKAEEFAAAFATEAVTGYENLLDREDIEAIYMPLPTGLHEEWVHKCLAAGKHVLAEKSLAIDHESARRMAGLAGSRELVLKENFMFKYHSQHNLTWKLLEEQQLGRLRLFRSQFGFPPMDRTNFRYDKSAGGGSLLDAGAYTVKASQWFLGHGLEVLDAVLYFDEVTGVDIYGNACLLSRRGIVAQISFGFDNYYQCNYELWGSGGRLVAERAFTPKPAERPSMLVESPERRERVELEADDHFKNILISLYDNIRQGDFSSCLDEILDQSRVLTDIRDRAKHIRYESSGVRR